jgi:hypothetical protein
VEVESPRLVAAARGGDDRPLDRDEPAREGDLTTARGHDAPRGLDERPPEAMARRVPGEHGREPAAPAIEVRADGLGLVRRRGRGASRKRRAVERRLETADALADSGIVRPPDERESLLAGRRRGAGRAAGGPRHPDRGKGAVHELQDRLAARLQEHVRQLARMAGERLEPGRDLRDVVHGGDIIGVRGGAGHGRHDRYTPRMAVSETRKEFIAVQTARGLASRKLFEERVPGALKGSVLAALAEEVEKERTLDEEARRMMEAARHEIASGKVDGQELFRRIRRKLAEQRGIVL